jgi:hypothetical protein
MDMGRLMDPHVDDVAAMTDRRGFFDVDVASMPIERRNFPAQPRSITEGHDPDLLLDEIG